MTEDKKIRVTLVKSPIGYNKKQKAVVQALGLRKMNHTVEYFESPMITGMLNKIPHLLKVER